jgi:DNA-binding NarL/FixJ family response regulator
MSRIRILLIEDNRLIRNGVISILKSHKDIDIVAASGNSKNTILTIHKLKPNVVLLDLGLRSQNSLYVVEVVRKEFPEAKIIVMDLAPVHADILQYVKAGASGFILKDASLDDFLITIRSVAKGKKVLPPLFADSLFAQIIEYAVKDGKGKLKDAVKMTKREKEIIKFISIGMNNKEIGQKIRISTYTVKGHIHNIMEKLALHAHLEVANYSLTEETLKKIAKSISILNS